jgi:hypothetical protein
MVGWPFFPSPKRQRGGPRNERGTKTTVRSGNDRELKALASPVRRAGVPVLQE